MAVVVHEFRRRGGGVLEFGTHEALMDRAGAGPHAVELLECFGDREASEEALLASVRAAARVEAHGAWLTARYAARLASSARFVYPDFIGVVNVAAEEISVGLRVSLHVAERYVKVGGAITGALCATGDALEVGVISFEHAWVITECLSGVDLTVAIPVEELALVRAVERTPAELRRDIARLLIEFDPETADDRARVAAGKRRVGRVRPAADGMARMSLFLPAPDAVALDTALDAAATAARGGGDCRTRDQLRADTMTGWAHAALANGTEVRLSDGSTVRSAPAKIAVTIPLEVLLRALPGFTPPPSVADVFRAELANNAGPDDPDDPGNPGNPSDPYNPGTAPESGGVGVGGPVEGHRTEAPWLEGYGPISPTVALLLAAGGTWQRIVTDPLTGVPLDIGRARYVPPSQIRTAARLRDHTCVRPGCSIPSYRCDGDHVHEWAQGGVTSLVNHAPECPRHHRIKSAGAAQVGPLQADGARTWTSAFGKTYRRLPERSPRQHGGTPPAGPAPAVPPEVVDRPPPF